MNVIDWLSERLPLFQADGFPALVLVLPLMLLAELVFRVGRRVVRRASQHAPMVASVGRAIEAPAHVALQLLALNLAWQQVPIGMAGQARVERLLTLLLIAVMTWLIARAVHGVARGVAEANPMAVSDNLAARRIRTQTMVLSRTVQGLVVLIGVSLMLMTFPAVRQIGTSLLASAGVVGIVAGFAARPVLGNLIAGLQIGLSQPIRIDDVVIVENEWGVIEEITGTYVVVRIWDQRRLVVPLQYWIEKPFQNWTRNTSELIGTVFLWVDYRMPLAPLREALAHACENSPHWDRRFARLQVVEAGEKAMQLRCLVTAASASAAWDLRCHVREQLIDFVQREYPGYLPRHRAELDQPEPPAPIAADASAGPAQGGAEEMKTSRSP
ncbi:mechanosensitive ion channel family protein [Hydrogenophaga sp. 2FB]|uniref:mechanosensitive ion channel family protein n=1 Tax=Hydrogenophaga sp. 2FB TaxID=2502187 RepID=UPI0010F64159|nr:mechanosensitive ion channel family protein [Hydrogenophaga sp. 2FB]